jgi:hypothetical protein
MTMGTTQQVRTSYAPPESGSLQDRIIARFIERLESDSSVNGSTVVSLVELLASGRPGRAGIVDAVRHTVNVPR